LVRLILVASISAGVLAAIAIESAPLRAGGLGVAIVAVDIAMKALDRLRGVARWPSPDPGP